MDTAASFAKYKVLTYTLKKTRETLKERTVLNLWRSEKFFQFKLLSFCEDHKKQNFKKLR